MFWRSDNAPASSSTVPQPRGRAVESELASPSAPLPAEVWLPDAAQTTTASTSTATTPTDDEPTGYPLPTNLVLVPAVAGAVGFLLGARRGGSAARLRFLAENAHRQPTTVQGWYFYLKTRNYKVFAGGMKTGAKYALGLGSATAAFVAADEAGGWLRERFEAPRGSPGTPFTAGPTEANSSRWGWRKGPVKVGDGLVAGFAFALPLAIAYRFPTPVLFRALLMGSGAGAVYSGMMIVQDKLAVERRAEEAAKTAAEEAKRQQEREERVAQGLSPEPEPTPDELKKPEDRNVFEKIGAWARGRD